MNDIQRYFKVHTLRAATCVAADTAEDHPFCSRRIGLDGADNDTLTRDLNSILASQFAAHLREQFRAFASVEGTDYGEFMRYRNGKRYLLRSRH